MTAKKPKNLDECLEMLLADSDVIILIEWSESDEDTATAEVHHGLGTSIRNKWNLWNPESELSKYFKKIGISHPDDMSGIIFTSLHRKLNDKDIGLEGQVKYYWKHWLKYNGQEVLPPSIEGVNKEYLELYEEFIKETGNGNKEG